MPDSLSAVQNMGAFCLEKLSDEQLVQFAENGDVSSFETLVNRYKDFVKACAKSYFLLGADHEDVIQEGMIGLFKAVQSFRPERKVSFKTFASLCIKRQIISAVKMSSRQKHMPLNTYVSLNKQSGGAAYYEHIVYTSEGTSADPEQIMIDKESMNDAHHQLDKVLSNFEAQVLMHHLHGEPYWKIAEHLGREPKSVDNALQRIKRKVLKGLLQKDLLS